jgi:hypothetical protein
MNFRHLDASSSPFTGISAELREEIEKLIRIVNSTERSLTVCLSFEVV